MAKAKACGAKGAKGGRSHHCGGARGCGKLPTGKSFTEDAKAINARVCRHARDCDVRGLLDYAVSQKDHMNHVNLTTAMHKLAQLAKDGNMAVHLGDWRFAVLHDRVQSTLALQSREVLLPGAEVLPRCWSTLAWTYATLGVPGLHLQPIFDTIAELSVPNIEAFNTIEFTNLVWAFAKAQVSNAHFFQAARSYTGINLAAFSPSQLSMLVWALVTAKYDQAGILCKLAEKFVQRPGGERADPVAVSNVMWGLATAKVHPKISLLQSIGSEAAELLPAFKPQELSITAWAFSRLRVRHDRFFAAVAGRLCRGPDVRRRMHAQGLANLMWAFNRQRALGSGVWAQLASAMRAMLPQCAVLLDQFKAQELSCICQSLQESGVQWGTCQEATAFWDMATTQEISHLQSHGGSGIPPQQGLRQLSEGILETASTGTGGSGPYAHSDAGSQDGDAAGVLGNDARAADHHGEAALHHSSFFALVGVNARVAAADGHRQMLQARLPAEPARPMRPLLLCEALHALGTPGPDRCEDAEGTHPCMQPRPQPEAGGGDPQAGRVLEDRACYSVKNTFVEEAGLDSARMPEGRYVSEPLPARADLGAGKLLTFPVLRQRPVHSK